MRIHKSTIIWNLLIILALLFSFQANAQTSRSKQEQPTAKEENGFRSLFKKKETASVSDAKKSKASEEAPKDKKTLNFLHKNAKSEVKATKKERKAAEAKERAARARADAIKAEKRAVKREDKADKANQKAIKARSKASWNT